MSAEAKQTFSVSQGKETRDVVTPYAFSVCDDLVGIPLASPIRRGMALLIDLLLVAMLTNVSSMFLAGLVAIMFFRAGNRLKQKKRFNGLRILLRGFAALMLFVFALGVFDYTKYSATDERDYYDMGTSYYTPEEDKSGENFERELSAGEALKLVGLTAKYVTQAVNINQRIENQQCQDKVGCWEELVIPLANDLGTSRIPQKDAITLFDEVLEQTEASLERQQVAVLKERMTEVFVKAKQSSVKKTEDGKSLTEPSNDSSPETAGIVTSEQQEPIAEKENETETIESSPENYSVIEWVKGIVKDLGLGFGWAAFYFTASVAWLKGYTPGKSLLGIKIIKLDGKALNLWESFGRYGGYGAGLATGLTGFLQIIWDPNRQAIHDKISETLVIDTRKPRVKVEVVTDGESSQTNTGKVASSEG